MSERYARNGMACLTTRKAKPCFLMVMQKLQAKESRRHGDVGTTNRDATSESVTVYIQLNIEV